MQPPCPTWPSDTTARGRRVELLNNHRPRLPKHWCLRVGCCNASIVASAVRRGGRSWRGTTITRRRGRLLRTRASAAAVAAGCRATTTTTSTIRTGAATTTPRARALTCLVKADVAPPVVSVGHRWRFPFRPHGTRGESHPVCCRLLAVTGAELKNPVYRLSCGG